MSRTQVDALLVALMPLACLFLFLLTNCATPMAYSPIRNNLHIGQHGLRPADLATGAVTAPDSLRIAAYNVYLSQDIDLAIADLQNNPNLAGADILLLQEMGTLGVDRIARALQMNYVYWPSFVQPRSGRLFGNAVLARWPITGQKAVTLPHPNPIIGLQRLAVAADIQVGERQVRAVSVHLATMAVSLEKRLEQARTMIDSLGTADGPVIFGGDFNTVGKVGRNKVRRLMRKAGYRPVRLPPGPTATSRRLGFTPFELILDHVYQRGFKPGTSGIDRTARASDHYPIWATLAWGKNR